MPSYESLREIDPQVYDIVVAERARQDDGLELIASENFVSEAVLDAAKSIGA